jgi:hypothetical protein
MLGLLAHDVGYGAGQSRFKCLFVNRLAFHFGRQHPEHVVRARQASNMGGENPVGAMFHRVLFTLITGGVQFTSFVSQNSSSLPRVGRPSEAL